MYQVQDAKLTLTFALPNGAATTQSDWLDLGLTERSDFVAPHEVEISVPALTTAELPDNETLTIDVQHAQQDDQSDAASLIAAVGAQTGAGGAGAAAATYRVVLPTHVRRYVRVRATNSGIGDQSAKSATVKVLT